MDYPQAAWQNMAVDRLVSRGPCVLHAVYLLTSTDGGDVTLYEGQDSASGDKIITVEGSADRTKVVHFSPALPCQRGLYVDVGSNVTEVMVHYSRKSLETDFSE